MKRKKTYRSPIIELVKIDRELVLLSTSENTGPDPGGGGPEKTSKHQPDSFDKNRLNDNPFER